MIFLWPDAGAYVCASEVSLTQLVSMGLTAISVHVEVPDAAVSESFGGVQMVKLNKLGI